MLSPAGPERERQLGVLLWMLDRLAIRVGSSSASSSAAADDADRTRGASTLLASDVIVAGRATVRLDFIGKDGVRYLRTFTPGDALDRAAIRALTVLRRAARSPSAQLLPLVTADVANAAVGAMLPRGATCKTLRTCAACTAFERLLHAFDSARAFREGGLSRAEAALALLLAHARAAVLCNHRSGTGTSSAVDASASDRTLDALHTETLAALSAAGGSGGRKQRVADLTRRVRSEVVRPAGLLISTSRTNYLDPRITTTFMARAGLPPETAFTASLVRRFRWALAAPSTDFEWSANG